MKTPFIEQDCTVTDEGRSYTSGGAAITDDWLVAYVGKLVGDGMGCDRFGDTSRRYVTDWHGNVIGHCALCEGWRVRSYIGNRMYQIYATVNGVTYTGRGFGEGMPFRARRVKGKLR